MHHAPALAGYSHRSICNNTVESPWKRQNGFHGPSITREEAELPSLEVNEQSEQSPSVSSTPLNIFRLK